MSNGCAVRVDGRQITVPEGTSVAAAVVLAGGPAGGLVTRRSVTDGAPRGPLCGMGICFECRVTVDGRPHVRACMHACSPGMEIRTDG